MRNITNNNEEFHFSPVITVTVKGGDEMKLQERITVQVKKVLREEFQSVRRKYPRLLEA